MLNSETRKWWALGALTLAVLAVGLDGTVLSVALPTLATALNATESELQWFSSAYLLVLAAGMLPAGLLGDRYGRKKAMLVALALFGVGSVACAFAPSPAAFIAARAMLGLAGAGVVVMALSALTVLFTEKERPRAVGLWSAANFLALPIGPILGGWLLTHLWWGWVFLINVPVALIGLIAALVLVPESRSPERGPLDLVGLLASGVGLVAVTYGLIEAGQNGWAAGSAAVPMIAGVVLLVGFVAWERRLGGLPGGRPLIDLGLFHSAGFTWGVILAAIVALSMIGALFTLPQYFQAVQGTDAMGSGLRLQPLIAGLVAGAVPADRIAGRIGPKSTVAVGFAVLATGLGIGATTTIGSGVGFNILWVALVGIGMGLALATSVSAALSELPKERSGVGSAMMQALQKVGGPFGVAIFGSVFNSVYRAQLDVVGLPPSASKVVLQSVFGGLAVAHQLGSLPLRDSVRSAFVQGMDVALMVSVAIAIAGIALAVGFLPGRAPSKSTPKGSVGKDRSIAATG